MQNRISEIQSFLEHHDHSLAVRRMLDTALDTGDRHILRETIAWSKACSPFQGNASGEKLPDDLYEQALALLGLLKGASTDYNHNGTRLMNAQQIGKKYKNSNFSLHPISLQINTGDVFGVVGQNGNGKTTLLRCLAGQLAFDEGTLEFSQLKNPDHYSIKQHIAFIPQRIPRWYGFLKDNLHFSASLSGVTGAENELMVDFMLERLGLQKYAHLDWNQISSGYRTRFELARILLQKPRLLILDEPLANLDINAQQTILTDLRYMAKSLHNPMAIILSSQQLHEVENVADTVLFIKEGSCIFRTGEQDAVPESHVIELETDAPRESLVNALGEENITLSYNGGFYTITSSTYTAQEMISSLIQQKIPVNYFRDITHSTKRFF